jgi:4,5:9,10-diseco-3-hydroxy-5,9,17-trioxoandrosta-1(10),2-diene-4-oate hydrolase
MADVEPVFRWLNLGLYLPLCVLLALAAYRVSRQAAIRGWTRWGYLVPVVVSAVAAFAAYLPMNGPDRIPAPSPESRFADTAVARFHYLREGSGRRWCCCPVATPRPSSGNRRRAPCPLSTPCTS